MARSLSLIIIFCFTHSVFAADKQSADSDNNGEQKRMTFYAFTTNGSEALENYLKTSPWELIPKGIMFAVGTTGIIGESIDGFKSSPRFSGTVGIPESSMFGTPLDTLIVGLGIYVTGYAAIKVHQSLRTRTKIWRALNPKSPLSPTDHWLGRFSLTYATALGVTQMIPPATHVCAKVIAAITQAL